MKILLSSSAAGCYLLVAALATAGAQNNNVVTACVSKSTSKARVVSSASNCDTATETVVLWNLTGPQGLPGPVGATGSTGAVGPAGSQGPIGMMGATGAAGPQGKVGRAGMTGPVGAQGPLGSTGAAGPQGSQGPAGYSAMPVIEWFTASSYVVPQSGIADSTTRYEFALSCPDQSVLVGSGCGPLQGHDYIVQHVGPDTDSGVTNTGTKVQTMSCTVYGGANSSEAQTILYSAGCLANRTSNYSDDASARSKTYSTCTYDPDTQQPCTRADAVVTSPAAAMTANPTAAQVAAAKTLALRDSAQQQATVAAGQPTPKVTHKLKTLWFEN